MAHYFVIEELETIIEQTFTTKYRMLINGIRPFLFLSDIDNIIGTFTLSLVLDSEVVASKDFTATDVKAFYGSANPYQCVWYAVQFDEPVQIDPVEYTIRLSASGYTPNSSQYLSWISEHENVSNPVEEPSDLTNPFSFQLWEFKR